MGNLLFFKQNLSSDFIDASIGEPHIIRNNLFKIFQLDTHIANNKYLQKNDLSYVGPTGYMPLVKLLEEKHNAPVVITNGATQGLAACLYALKQFGVRKIGLKTPYWPPILQSLKIHKLKHIFSDPSNYRNQLYDAYMLVAPNNPDGYCNSPAVLEQIYQTHKANNIFVIHDAAYYAHSYLSDDHTLPAIGDVQVFSFSKLLGLPGMRIGYVVCHNPKLYNHIQDYIETITGGTSINSQVFLYDILNVMHNLPISTKLFERTNYYDIKNNKNLFSQLNPAILNISNDVLDTPGMFLWAPCKKPKLFEKTKIHIGRGQNFGATDYVRINLALDSPTIRAIINRLNEAHT